MWSKIEQIFGGWSELGYELMLVRDQDVSKLRLGLTIPGQVVDPVASIKCGPPWSRCISPHVLT